MVQEAAGRCAVPPGLMCMALNELVYYGKSAVYLGKKRCFYGWVDGWPERKFIDRKRMDNVGPGKIPAGRGKSRSGRVRLCCTIA